MPIKLMYITNKPQIAIIAQKYGVDIIFVDLETIGKEARQHGMNTVKSNHVIDDVRVIRSVLTSSKLLVRVNPLYEGSKDEIDTVIEYGADIVMLPMFENSIQVKEFVSLVNKRADVMLLVETKSAMENLKEISNVPGVDEIHIGLNDLHLQLNKKFMFELLSDGTVESMCKVLKNSNIKSYGFGGIARLDEGMLPARHILGEHYRLGSSAAILSRSFYDSWLNDDLEEIDRVFKYGVSEIREFERRLSNENKEFFIKNHKLVCNEVDIIVKKK